MSEPQPPEQVFSQTRQRYPMTWRRWRIGFALVILECVFIAGAGAVAGANVVAILAVFCAAAAPRTATYSKTHPIDEVSFDTQTFMKNLTTKLLLLLAVLLLIGCARVRVYDDSKQAGFVATTPAWPWQDSTRVLDKLNLSSKTNSFTASVRGLSESESTSTNTTEFISAVVGAAVRAGISAAK